MRRTLMTLGGALMLPATAAAQTLTDGERAELHGSLARSYERVAWLTETLSADQWTFKPAADRWSVGEVAEHILVSEQLFMQLIKGPLLQAPRGDASDVKEIPSEEIMTLMRDRSQRFQAPEPAQPTGRWPTQDAFLAEWKAERKANLEWVKTTDADLHGHVMQHPALGLVDGMRWIAFMAAHAERHLLQIDEVMEHPGYPKRTM